VKLSTPARACGIGARVAESEITQESSASLPTSETALSAIMNESVAVTRMAGVVMPP
jgi:hypothetical protein